MGYLLQVRQQEFKMGVGTPSAAASASIGASPRRRPRGTNVPMSIDFPFIYTGTTVRMRNSRAGCEEKRTSHCGGGVYKSEYIILEGAPMGIRTNRWAAGQDGHRDRGRLGRPYGTNVSIALLFPLMYTGSTVRLCIPPAHRLIGRRWRQCLKHRFRHNFRVKVWAVTRWLAMEVTRK